MNRILVAAFIACATFLTACEKKSSESKSAPSASETKKAPASTGSAEVATGPGHGGGVIELGETTVGGMKVRASRDVGEFKAGGDSPVDIWIDGGLGNASGVRFWIGTEDAKGSLKAKTAVEDGHWHTHGEIPDPLPVDSKLWVEIEHSDGKNSMVSFDLRK